MKADHVSLLLQNLAGSTGNIEVAKIDIDENLQILFNLQFTSKRIQNNYPH